MSSGLARVPTGFVDGSASEETRAFGVHRSFKRRVLCLLLVEGQALRWMLGGALVEGVLGLAGPWLSSMTIDTALPNQAANTLAVVALMILVLAVHVAWIGWVHEKVAIVITRRIETTCLRLVLERFLETEFATLRNEGFGETNQTMSAVGATSVALTHAVVGVLTQALSGIAFLGLLAVWFPLLSAIVLGATLVMAALSSAYSLREARLARATLDASSQQQDLLYALLRALATLRVAGATDRCVTHWKHLLTRQAQAIVTQQEAAVSRSVVLDGIPQLVSLGVTAWLVNAAMNGEATLGQLVMATTLVGGAIAAFVNLIGTFVAFQAMRPHFARVDRLLEEGERGRRTNGTSSSVKPQTGDLVLEHVTFSYGEGEREILSDLSTRFPARELSVLRAASGTGKTTLLRLLAGLYAPKSGTVRVLGHAPHVHRNLVIYLPQQAALLQGSIATNLKLLSGRPLDDSLEIAKLTGLSTLLESLPMGVETVVSGAGGNLSAGQKQLVLLTAAFASARPVVLLDEATSQLDESAQRSIDWQALARGKTVVMVRHD